MSSIQARKDEILAKKAKLAELKRQRKLRQKEFSTSRQSIGESSEVCEQRQSGVFPADVRLASSSAASKG